MIYALQMVDLKTQYEKIKEEIDNAIFSVIKQTSFIKGEDVKIFENKLAEYLDVKHVISCANGTDALQIALMSLGLEPEDEIITTSFTFVATAEVIALLNLKPVFVDVVPDTFLINPEEIEKKITPKTKAIIPVHLFGQCANMDEILKICRKHNLLIIEDTAQALGSDYYFSNNQKTKAGCIGNIGTTSFFPSKNLGCFGDGGALFTNNDTLAENIRSISNHGMKVRYYHDIVGINSRLDTIQAALLNVKLKYLDEYNRARQKAASYYDNAFNLYSEKIRVPGRNVRSTHIFHQYTLVTKDIDRDGLKNYLQSKGIPSMIYYPVPLHLQNAYKYLGYKEGDFPYTEQLCKSVISLPMHTELDEEQLQFITKTVIEFIS